MPPRLIPEGHPQDLLGRIKDLHLSSATVLNLGAGICGSPISAQMHYLPCRRLIHVEKFRPYMEQLKTMPFAAKEVEFHEVDIMEFLQSSAMPEVDVTLFIDVLEHLKKPEAERALDIVMKKTRQRILIWLPLGDCPIEPFHNNPYQAHLSTWHPDDKLFQGHTVEQFPAFHTHLDPPVDAGWITINMRKPSKLQKALQRIGIH